jgi:ribonuclease D
MIYAIEDVKHLLDIHDQLCKQLEQMGRLSWATEECKRYSDPARYDKDRSMDFLRIKGASALNRKTLGVLQALCDWRHEEAMRVNKPIKSILSDNTLLELARRPPRQIDDIKRVRSIRPDQVRNFGTGITRATEKGLGTPENLLPTWPSSRMPPKKDVLIADMLFALLKVFAYQAELATELVGTRDDVQAFVRAFRDGKKAASSLPLLHGWRWDLAGSSLWSVLEATPVTIICDDNLEPPVKIHLSPK